MTFDTARLTITQRANGSLKVEATTVKWNGSYAFSTNNSAPTCPGVPLPPGRPLSTGACVAGPGVPPLYYTAPLTFSGDIDDWHPHFHAGREITQRMVVNGVLKDLKIQLSCDAHTGATPQNHAAGIIRAAGSVTLLVLQVFHLAFRRLFGTAG